MDRLKASGCFLGGEALQPISTAATVRGNGDKVLTIDGPFAETKEQLGGFHMVECQDLDEAPSLIHNYDPGAHSLAATGTGKCAARSGSRRQP